MKGSFFKVFNAEAQSTQRVFRAAARQCVTHRGSGGYPPLRYKTLLMYYYEIGSQCEASSNHLCVLRVSAPLR